MNNTPITEGKNITNTFYFSALPGKIVNKFTGEDPFGKMPMFVQNTAFEYGGDFWAELIVESILDGIKTTFNISSVAEITKDRIYIVVSPKIHAYLQKVSFYRKGLEGVDSLGKFVSVYTDELKNDSNICSSITKSTNHLFLTNLILISFICNSLRFILDL